MLSAAVEINPLKVKVSSHLDLWEGIFLEYCVHISNTFNRLIYADS